MDTVAFAKRVWSWLEKSSGSRDVSDLKPYFDVFADDISLRVDGPRSPNSNAIFPGEIRGKQALIDFYTTEVAGDGETPDFELERPLEFLGDEKRVVILGSETYRLRNGVTASGKEFAIVMDIENGKITKIRQICDMSEYQEAYSA